MPKAKPTPIFLVPYQRYFDFQGRSRRWEFWGFYFFVLGVSLGLIATALATCHVFNLPLVCAMAALMLAVFWLASAIPMVAATVRRLHDADYSGFWIFVECVPLIGWLVLVIMLLLPPAVRVNAPGLTDKDAKAGINRFGPPPKI